jgi:xanthosine utilization system XapX-like protein
MMNAANRLFSVLGSLLLISLVVAVIVLTWALPNESIERMGDLVQYVDAHNNTTSQLVITLGGTILILLTLIVLLLEIASPAAPVVAVKGVESGTAFLSTDAIARRLEELMTGVTDVMNARAKVVRHGKGIDVSLTLYVDPGVDVAAVADEACRVVQDAVTERMKVEMHKLPRVRLHYERHPSRIKKVPAPPPAQATVEESPVKLPRQRKESPAPQSEGAEEEGALPEESSEDQA